MKTNIPRRLLRSALLASLAATFVATVSGQPRENKTVDASVKGLAALAEPEVAGLNKSNVRLSAPGQPATLILDMPWADIRITGVDGDTVTVESTISQKNAKPARPGGLRRLDDEVTFELVEHENVVTLSLAGDNPWAGHDAEFKVSVPRAMALNLKTDAGGDLVVQGVEGDVEINNMNGEVKLEGLVGSAVINTMNGEVRAVYAKVPLKPISITSMNGEVDLRLPADTKANVRLRTHNGSILTDFSEDALKTKTEGGKSSGYSYGYAYTAGDAARLGAGAARAAADAARMAAVASRDVAREVAREVSRSLKETPEAEAPEAPEAAAPVAPRAPRAPRAPMAAIAGGKLVTGTLNGGGVDIKVSTMNGEITLRQTK